MNMVYIPNYLPNKESITASLYILGFYNQHGIYKFNIQPWPGQAIEGTVLNSDGSYPSLWYNNGSFPTITAENIRESIVHLLNFQKKQLNKSDVATCQALVRLIIVTSEAIRFLHVAHGIESTLKIRGSQYRTPWQKIHHWNGMIAGFERQLSTPTSEKFPSFTSPLGIEHPTHQERKTDVLDRQLYLDRKRSKPDDDIQKDGPSPKNELKVHVNITIDNDDKKIEVLSDEKMDELKKWVNANFTLPPNATPEG